MSLNPNVVSLSHGRVPGVDGALPTTRGGNLSRLNITAATVVKATPGRIAKVTVNVAGAAGTVSDCITTGAVAASNLVWAIPAVVGVYDLDWPCLLGIVVTPGAAQVVSISYN